MPKKIRAIKISKNLAHTGAKNCLLINCIRNLIEPQDPSMEKTANKIINIARKNEANFMDGDIEKFVILVGIPGQIQSPSTKKNILDLLLMTKSIMNRVG